MQRHIVDSAKNDYANPRAFKKLFFTLRQSFICPRCIFVLSKERKRQSVKKSNQISIVKLRPSSYLLAIKMKFDNKETGAEA